MNKKSKQKNSQFLDGIFSLEGKTAIVTGAARGNGQAIANGFLAAGAFVYFVDIINPEEPELFKKQSQAVFINADISKKEDLERIISKIKKSGRTIDTLVNNAGITVGYPSEEYPIDQWEKTIAVNLTAHFQLSQLVAREMIKSKKEGSIINIASISSKFGYSNNPAYVAAKGGLASLTRALAKDWAKYGIRVNSISPGYMHTAMTAKSYADPEARAARLERAMIKRYGEPKELVGAAVFLASGASSYVTGSDITVDGGWSVSGF
ncbi:MAG: SDR family oxidoreductase [Patescibacteria group bacterium]